MDKIISYQQDNKDEIILYQPDNSLKLEVRIEEETVWLNRQQISVLFDRDVKTIGKHINNALNEELQLSQILRQFKDLGKKLFAFSKMEITATDILKYN